MKIFLCIKSPTYKTQLNQHFPTNILLPCLTLFIVMFLFLLHIYLWHWLIFCSGGGRKSSRVLDVAHNSMRRLVPDSSITSAWCIGRF